MKKAMMHDSLKLIRKYFVLDRRIHITLKNPKKTHDGQSVTELIGSILRYEQREEKETTPKGDTITFTIIPSFDFLRSWDKNLHSTETNDNGKRKFEINVAFDDIEKIQFVSEPMEISGISEEEDTEEWVDSEDIMDTLYPNDDNGDEFSISSFYKD